MKGFMSFKTKSNPKITYQNPV